MKTETETVAVKEKEIEPSLLAAEWLLHSGIQNEDPDPRTKGGVNAWYDFNTDTRPFLYSEITGYAINAYLFFHAVTKDNAYLERAQWAGEWVIRNAHGVTGLMLTRLYHEHAKQAYYDSWIFTFDQWMIIFGLANLAKVAGDASYLEKAELMAQFLIEHTLRKDGSMYPVYDLDGMKPAASDDKWSRQSGSFHAKALMGLGRLYAMTHSEIYLKCAKRLAKAAVTDQERSGRFVTQANEDSTHLHPHLYSVEGLLWHGVTQKDEPSVKAAIRGLEWALEAVDERGVLYSFYKDKKFLPCERADVMAQALRMGVIVRKRFQGNPMLGKRLELLRKKLLAYQIKSKSQQGGFFYGQDQDGSIPYHANARVTMFAAQALWLYDHFELDGQPDDLSFFV